jgi:DNA/RNA-binding domain of Phe-tRNA-synthetase-like protein
VARRWCWRQSAESAARASTTDILVTVEGHHDDAGAAVSVALDELAELIRRYAAPATIERARLTVTDSVFD